VPHRPRPVQPEIYLAEPAVKAPVTRILAKHGLRDRVQAVVFASESGLIKPGRN
jgi:DNA-binding NarL/FixJ family response regulator